MSLTLHKEQQSTHNHSIIILITIIILLTVILMILALELRVGDMDKVFYYGIFHFILHYPYTVYCGIVHFLET